MKKKVGVLVGAAPIGKEREELQNLLKQSGVYKVAVDGGITFFLENRIRPDYWLGDMDSAKERGANAVDEAIKTSRVSPIKDETDMALALSHVVAAGCQDVLIYGGLGGLRVAHTFANFQLLHQYAKKCDKCKVTMVSERNRIFALHNGKLDFPKREQGLISIFSLSDCSLGVRIKGLFYEFEGVLTNDNALGISNEFCGKAASIEVEEGTLLVIYEPKSPTELS